MDYSDESYKFMGDLSSVFTKNIYQRLRNKVVLDLGCGSGVYLKQFSKGSVGIDMSPQNIILAGNLGHKVLQMDLNAPINLDEKFDAVFSSHVIEHVESPIEYLRYAYKHLQDGGTFVLSIPNEDGLIHLRYPYFTRDGNHLYAFSIDNMQELLGYTGFKQIECLYDVETALTRKLKIGFLLEVAIKFSPKFIKKKLAWSFWFVATKSNSDS